MVRLGLVSLTFLYNTWATLETERADSVITSTYCSHRTLDVGSQRLLSVSHSQPPVTAVPRDLTSSSVLCWHSAHTCIHRQMLRGTHSRTKNKAKFKIGTGSGLQPKIISCIYMSPCLLTNNRSPVFLHLESQEENIKVIYQVESLSH